MTEEGRPAVLQALADAAVASTGASVGWLLRLDGDELEVVAAAGDDAGRALGVRVGADTGSAGYVVASGQPLAVSGGRSDERFTEGVARAVGRRPHGVLCVPCEDGDGVLGALELLDKQGDEPFTLDDVEIVTVLGGVAGAALSDGAGTARSVPAPGELAAELRTLADLDPNRYALVAGVVAALIGDG